jgi:hypothetical protein
MADSYYQYFDTPFFFNSQRHHFMIRYLIILKNGTLPGVWLSSALLT